MSRTFLSMKAAPLLALALLACTMAQAQETKAQLEAEETKTRTQDTGSARSVMNADHRVMPIDSSVDQRVTAVKPRGASSDDTQGGGKHPQSSASKWGPVPSTPVTPVPAASGTPEGDAARREAEERRRRQEPDESLADSTRDEKSPAEKNESARTGSVRKKIRAPQTAAPESASGKESAIRNPLLVERSSLRESSRPVYRSSMHAMHPQAKRTQRPAAKSKTSLNAGLNSSTEQPLKPLQPSLKSQKPAKSSISDVRSSILGTDAR
jgi:hypothetical protein